MQGYLGEFGSDPLRLAVESHLAVCARCRASFDRVVATNRRVNSWLAKLSPVEGDAQVDASRALRLVLCRTGSGEQVFRSVDLRSINPRALVSSFVFQGAMVALLLSFGASQVVRTPVTLMTLIAPPPAAKPVQHHSESGGGGQRSPLPLILGQLPRHAPKVFTPTLVAIERPVLTMDTSLITPSDAWATPTGPIGDPLGVIGGAGGPGSNGSLGSGPTGGIGDKSGPGGEVGIFTVGSGTTRPEVITRVDPEYSEEARKAKYSGSVILTVIVGTDGKAADIQVAKSLGMGLDEKAVDAVRQWRFKPGMNKGKPVRVRAQIEVNFRLL